MLLTLIRNSSILITARKGPRNYTIETTCASFDDFHSTTLKFKAALFYESMHHCEKVCGKPLRTFQSLSKMMAV